MIPARQIARRCKQPTPFTRHSLETFTASPAHGAMTTAFVAPKTLDVIARTIDSDDHKGASYGRRQQIYFPTLAGECPGHDGYEHSLTRAVLKQDSRGRLHGATRGHQLARTAEVDGGLG